MIFFNKLFCTISVFCVFAVSEMLPKRSPLGTMRFGKRTFESSVFDDEYSDNFAPNYIKRANNGQDEQVYRDARAPLGTMRFGKRSAGVDDAPFGTMRFGKREADNAPFGTMRFGKRGDAPLGTMRFGKRSVDDDQFQFGTMRFGKRNPLGTMRFGK